MIDRIFCKAYNQESMTWHDAINQTTRAQSVINPINTSRLALVLVLLGFGSKSFAQGQQQQAPPALGMFGLVSPQDNQRIQATAQFSVTVATNGIGFVAGDTWTYTMNRVAGNYNGGQYGPTQGGQCTPQPVPAPVAGPDPNTPATVYSSFQATAPSATVVNVPNSGGGTSQASVESNYIVQIFYYRAGSLTPINDPSKSQVTITITP